jgi:Dirigent-like protein
VGVRASRGLPAVVAAAVLGTVAAGAQAVPSKTIEVTSVTVKMVTHDVGAKGASKGDSVTYDDSLLNAVKQFGKSKGARVGSDSGVMTFTSANSATFAGRAILPGGTLKLDGAVSGLANGGFEIPVVGGTGAFAHMTGTLTVGPGGRRVVNTYHLTRPSLPVA